jgi:alpha-amylase
VTLGTLVRAAAALVCAAALASAASHAGAPAVPTALHPPAERWDRDPADGVYYQVFVRSFQDSTGDGHGDLGGLRARLPYLAWLGIDGLWLTPIHPSPSYHGYDVIDYRAVHEDFGTIDSLRALLDDAHALGMRVVLDLVVNHTSSAHPDFAAALAGDLGARTGYVWSEEREDTVGVYGGPAWHPAGDGSYYLGLFDPGMPDLDHREPAVTEAMLDIATYWVDLGVDGFRIDAIQHVVEGADGTTANSPENVAWVRAFNAELRQRRPGTFIVGETWTSTPAIATYHREAGLDMSFNYPLWRTLLAAVSGRSAIDLRAQLELDEALYPPSARRGTFLANHDQVRPATMLSPLRRDEARLRLSVGLLLTLPGTPFLYYGEEIGMPNGPGSADLAKRTPMRWTADDGGGFTTGTPWQPPSTTDPAISVEAQRDDPGSLLSYYRRMIALRQETPALARGTTSVIASLPGTVLGFWREAEDARVLVVANLGAGATEVPLADLGAAGETLADLLTGTPVAGAVALEPTSLRVLGTP